MELGFKHGEFNFLCLKTLMLVIVLTCNATIHAQFFSKRYPLLAQTNGYISSIQIVDDTIYSMCQINDTMYSHFPVALFDRFDRFGNLISSNITNIPNHTLVGVNMNTLIHTNDNGFAYGGWAIDTSQNHHELIILKYDKTGIFQWYKEIIDSNSLAYDCEAFIQDEFSNFYLTGIIEHPSSHDVDIHITKTDSIGNLIYLKQFQHPNFYDGTGGICINSKGHIIIGGFAAVYDINDLTTYKCYSEIYELDSAANQLNYVLGTDTDGPVGTNMLPTSDGGYLVANSHICYRDRTSDKWQGSIAKLDSNFHELWRVDAGPCSMHTQFYAQKRSPDGNYIAVGQWYDESDTTTTHMNGWIMKYSEAGHILWTKQYRGVTSNGINGDDNIFASLAFLADNTIVIAGQATNADDTTPPFQQAWLLHLDTTGCLADSNSCGIVNGISEINRTNFSVLVYPNPALNEINFEVLYGTFTSTLQINDAMGQSMKAINFSQQNTEAVNVSQWSSGIYFYYVTEENGYKASGRFMVSH